MSEELSGQELGASAVRDALMIELAWCRHADLPVSETADRIMAKFVEPPKHKFWGAGEAGCPREIKAGNGELHTLRCRVCGQENPRDDRCFADAPNLQPPSTNTPSRETNDGHL